MSDKNKSLLPLAAVAGSFILFGIIRIYNEPGSMIRKKYMIIAMIVFGILMMASFFISRKAFKNISDKNRIVLLAVAIAVVGLNFIRQIYDWSISGGSRIDQILQIGLSAGLIALLIYGLIRLSRSKE